jgi:hypothetical protein
VPPPSSDGSSAVWFGETRGGVPVVEIVDPATVRRLVEPGEGALYYH